MEKLQISLAAARVNAKMTQEDVAKEMHVSKQTIVNWEKGKTVPGIPEIEKLSRIYKMPQDNIFLPYYSTKKQIIQKLEEGGESKLNIPEKSMYCLWNHLESFHRQAMDRKIADFGEPCSDCKYWLDCGGDWISKVGNTKPSDLEFSVVRWEPR